MAVAKVGSTGTKNDSGSSTTHTLAGYTLDSTATAITARLGWNAGGGVTISSVTWNGVAMSSVGASQADGDDNTAQMFILVNPDVGSHDLVVTTSASALNVLICADGWSGIDTASPTSGYQQTGGNGATPVSLTVASATGDMVIDCVCVDDSQSAALTMDGGQTLDAEVQAEQVLFGGTATGNSHKAGAASVVMTWTYVGTIQRAMVAVNLKAAGGGGGGGGAKKLAALGVG